jgi:RHS repeat-associated protein
MISATNIETRAETHMIYDALGRRRSKATGESITMFSWDGDQLLSDTVDGKEREFVYYPGSFEPLAVIDDTKTVNLIHTDSVGLPHEVTGSDGDLVWSACYDAHGCVETIGNEKHQNPLRFQGQYYDPEFDLSYNRYRYFDAKTGSFVSQDPLGLTAGVNIYDYSPNVWGWVDPLGLCEKDTNSPDSNSPGLKQQVRKEYRKLIDSGLSHREIGPSLSIAQDMKTGNISGVYRNDELGRMPSNLSNTISSRLGTTPEYIKTKGIGSHSEIYAVDELLKARPFANLEDISVFTMEVKIASLRGTYKPPCPHCAHLLEGVNFIK